MNSRTIATNEHFLAAWAHRFDYLSPTDVRLDASQDIEKAFVTFPPKRLEIIIRSPFSLLANPSSLRIFAETVNALAVVRSTPPATTS
jgi:hypothetical protein